MGVSSKHRILHVMRSPVGGLFRHVVDLARMQSARGHDVGIVADSSTGGERADAILNTLGQELSLGVSRCAMPREPGPGDFSACRHVIQRLRDAQADIVHGHGSKGGLYARLLAGRERLAVYTPHGGSLHYSRWSPVGFVYLGVEHLLAGRTDLFLFESAYGRETFRAKVCEPRGTVTVVHNGVGEDEFAPITPSATAPDLIFVGELRLLKGVDVLLRAMALLRAQGRPVTATIVGAGPDADTFRQLAGSLGLADAVTFPGAMPARQAFALGRVLVVPSRAESLPYIVLEAGAAGLAQIATQVGGVGEIFGDDAGRLVPPDRDDLLAGAIADALDHPDRSAEAAQRLQARIRAHFSIAAMSDGVLAAYDAALAARQR